MHEFEIWCIDNLNYQNINCLSSIAIVYLLLGVYNK